MKLGKTFAALTILILTIIGLGFIQPSTSDSSTETVHASSDIDSVLIDAEVYPHDKVIDVNIEIDENTYQTLIEDATEQEYYVCDITYNGYTLTNVAIRTKGNSSLRDIALAGDDRFSFNIDLNYYLDQDLFGIDKLILNNLYQDPTMMAEFISYEALDSLGAVSSRTTYTALSINGEYFGLYLSVEDVGNEFLEENYGDSTGSFYKPELGTGSDLDYVSDTTNYSGLVDKNGVDLDNTAIIDLMEAISLGENIDEYLDIDSYLQYLALSTFTIHMDSYQGGMFHNYYLYNNDGVFEWITWDLNMTFNGYPGSGLTDAAAVALLIDEPVIGSLSNYPIVEAVLADAEYLELYHSYLQDLIDNYFDENTFETIVLEIYDLIDDYVRTDPSSLYTYSEFTSSLFVDSVASYSLTTFVEERSENISLQLSNEIPSTNDGLGNVTGSSSKSPGNGQNLPGGLTPPDGGLPDGGLPDGGLPDGGLPDGGLPDGELPDGELPPDGGLPDGGLPDGGLPDGELPDGGLPDGGEDVPAIQDPIQGGGLDSELGDSTVSISSNSMNWIAIIGSVMILGGTIFLSKKHF